MDFAPDLETAAALYASGDFANAAAVCRRILAAGPANAQAWQLFGAIALQCGEVVTATDAMRRAVELDPENADFLSNYALALAKDGRLRDATDTARAAVRRQPNEPAFLYNLALIYQLQRQYASAAEMYEQALQLNPNHVNALANLAGSMCSMSRWSDAIATGRRAVELDPSNVTARGNLATALEQHGDVAEMLLHLRQAVDLSPRNPQIHSRLLCTMLRHDECPIDRVFLEHLRWNERHAAPLAASILPHGNVRDPSRRVRLGYLSPNFRRHAVAYFVRPLLAAHDHGRFEITCYHDSPQDDDFTEVCRAHADRWRTVAGTNDSQMAELIRKDQIDILVDLTGHLEQNRLLVFARKPAPVQVTYLGYQATTGLATMDYRLSDCDADPPGKTDRFYTETLVRLPRFFVYGPAPQELGPLPPRADGPLTFASMNNANKVTPRVREAWANILLALPDARLLYLVAGGKATNPHVVQFFADRGVAPSRIELLDLRSRAEYLDLYRRIDINLDPFPFGGHTTTCDALWMGVPTLVLAGEHYVSRMGVSVLRGAGLEEWIADSIDGYVLKAITLGRQHLESRRLRETFRQRLQSSDAMDASRFTKNLEHAYKQMWRAWCEARDSDGHEPSA